MSSLTTGYYLIKSKSADGNVGIGANGSHDRRLVMLQHPEAHGIQVKVSLANPCISSGITNMFLNGQILSVVH
jgi:hypothetical protein